MNFDRIIASVPVSRTTAIGATGTNADATLTPLQKRENLIGLLHQLEKAIRQAKDPERKKYLGLRKLEVQNALNALPRRHTARGHNIADWIVEVVRERLPKAQWISILEEATSRYKAASAAEKDKS